MSKCTWCTRNTQETCPECWGSGEGPTHPLDMDDDSRINERDGNANPMSTDHSTHQFKIGDKVTTIKGDRISGNKPVGHITAFSKWRDLDAVRITCANGKKTTLLVKNLVRADVRALVELQQLEELEITIFDATPDELPALHNKLTALVEGLPNAIQAHTAAQVAEAELRGKRSQAMSSDDAYHDLASPELGAWLKRQIVDLESELAALTTEQEGKG